MTSFSSPSATIKNGSPRTCYSGINLEEGEYEERIVAARKRAVLDSTKILLVADGVAFSSKVRSGAARTKWHLSIPEELDRIVCMQP
jgi:hypothetical protein